MNERQFTRRLFLHSMAGIAAAAAVGRMPEAHAAEALRFWAPGIAKVGAKDFSAMEAQAGISIANTAKSARADEAIQKMVVGDGQKLFDALTDNGGGMEDALASQNTIVPLDTSKIPNWANILPFYRDGGSAAHTLRYQGKVYGIPYISNADSLAPTLACLRLMPQRRYASGRLALPKWAPKISVRWKLRQGSRLRIRPRAPGPTKPYKKWWLVTDKNFSMP